MSSSRIVAGIVHWERNHFPGLFRSGNKQAGSAWQIEQKAV